jgi:hypothetical protein
MLETGGGKGSKNLALISSVKYTMEELEQRAAPIDKVSRDSAPSSSCGCLD